MFDNLGTIAIVQCYIHHVKNIQVNIQEPRNQHEQELLHIAFRVATKYLNG